MFLHIVKMVFDETMNFFFNDLCKIPTFDSECWLSSYIFKS